MERQQAFSNLITVIGYLETFQPLADYYTSVTNVYVDVSIHVPQLEQKAEFILDKLRDLILAGTDNYIDERDDQGIDVIYIKWRLNH